jgi:hypothetical protein
MDIMWGKKWGKEIFVARFIFLKKKVHHFIYLWGQCNSFHMKQNVKI